MTRIFPMSQKGLLTTFKKEAREIIIVVMQKILEKRPLHSVVVKNANGQSQ